MRSIETHPTPQHVFDAVQVIAAWLREIEAAEALVSRRGGVSFHARHNADRLLAENDQLRVENAKLRAQLNIFWRDM